MERKESGAAEISEKNLVNAGCKKNGYIIPPYFNLQLGISLINYTTDDFFLNDQLIVCSIKCQNTAYSLSSHLQMYCFAS